MAKAKRKQGAVHRVASALRAVANAVHGAQRGLRSAVAGGLRSVARRIEPSE